MTPTDDSDTSTLDAETGAAQDREPIARRQKDVPTDRRLRIALLSYRSDPKVGGQGVFVAMAARALARRGHIVDVLSGPPYPRLPPEARLIRIPSLDLYAQPHNGHLSLRWRHLLSLTDLGEYFGHLCGRFTEPWSFGRRAAKYLRTRIRDYDVVVDNQTLAHGLLDIQRRGAPVVGVIHHPIHRDLEVALAAEPDKGRRGLLKLWYSFLPMQTKVAPQLNHVVVVSQNSRQDVLTYMPIPLERISVVPLGVDTRTFRPQPDIQRSEHRLFTTASADVPLKGLRFLIEAYAQLRQTRPDLELVVLGKLREGPTQELIESLGLAPHIQFISDLTTEQVAEEYARATLCITPSLYEGFGLPAAEAMCCGAPVIVTDGGSLPEVVGDSGVVVPKGDAVALAAAIDALLRDPERRRRLGAAAVEDGRRRLSIDVWAEGFERVLLQEARVTC